MKSLSYILAGESAFLIKFDTEISVKTHRRILGFLKAIQADGEFMKGIIDLVPSYADLMVYFNPLVFSYKEMLEKLRETEEKVKRIGRIKSRLIEIPVCYGGKYGEDIEFVAGHNNLSVEQVIQKHAKPKYLVYMLGFTPGFSYLGGLDKSIATPRKTEPRTAIPAGAVGIAGNQTGIYPIESPGGWQLIGQTPVKLFDAKQPSPVLLMAGDNIRFKPISAHEFDSISKAFEAGDYSIRIK